jgi:hypothetical protein
MAGEAVLPAMRQQPLVPVTRVDRVLHTVRWAPRELWQQAANVDPLQPNPTVSEFTRRSARRPSLKRANGRRFYESS